jgi:hypothetical protein
MSGATGNKRHGGNGSPGVVIITELIG